MMKLILILLLFTSVVGAEIIYIGQTSSGIDNGTSVENRHSMVWHNNSSNWSTTPGTTGKICPGDTIRFCTAISSNIYPIYGGSVGNWIVYDGAGNTFHGIIEWNHNGGTAGYYQFKNIILHSDTAGVQGSTFFNHGNAGTDTTKTSNYLTFYHITTASCFQTPLFLQYCRHVTIDACTLTNIKSAPIIFQRSCTGVIDIKNCLLTTDTVLTGNVQLDGIDIGDASNLTLENSTIINQGKTEGSSAHNDCVESYEGGGTPHAGPSKITIRNCLFVINTSKNDNVSWMMLENTNDSFMIYNNIFYSSRGGRTGNGININSSYKGAKFFFYNNTIVANGGGENLFRLSASNARLWFKNNIIYDSTGVGTMTQTYSNDSVVASNNCYYSIRSAVIWTVIESGSIKSNPKFIDKASNFKLQSTSPCIGTGIPSPLGSTYSTDYFNFNRTLPWDIGACKFVIIFGYPPRHIAKGKPQGG
jgi:hypothetical protein